MSTPPSGTRAAISSEHVARAVHAVRLQNLRPAHTVGVVGEGPVALATMAVALARGVGRVALVADSESASACAARAGAVQLGRPATEESLQEAHHALGGFGPDVVFECEGDAASRILAIELARPAGTVVLVSDDGQPTAMNPNLLVMSDKRVQGCRGFADEEMRIAQRLIKSGRLPLEELLAAGGRGR